MPFCLRDLFCYVIIMNSRIRIPFIRGVFMKFMDIFYKALGFETDDVKVTKKKVVKNGASYNLKVSENLPDEIDGVHVYYPETLDDCRDRVELLKKDTPFILDLRHCGGSEKHKILDYYSGVLDVLGAKQEMVDKNLYIFLPKNFEIEID